jgi:hypothetical protein
MIVCRVVLAVLAVVKVNEPVSCMAQVNFYHPPLSLMYAEVKDRYPRHTVPNGIKISMK